MRTLVFLTAVLLSAGAATGLVGQSTNPMSTQEKIENALSAGPEHIVTGAAVFDWSGDDVSVLREGTNGWTCFPSRPDTPGNDPLCADGVFLEVELAGLRNETITLDRVGLAYMLQGGIGVDDRGVQTLGPHIMMAMPAGGRLAEAYQQDPPEGLISASPVPGTVWIIMPIAPGGTTIP